VAGLLGNGRDRGGAFERQHFSIPEITGIKRRTDQPAPRHPPLRATTSYDVCAPENLSLRINGGMAGLLVLLDVEGELLSKTWNMTQAESLPPGLSEAEARRRLADIGPNATPDTDAHPLRLLLGKFIAPVPCLLEAAIGLQLLLGEYLEASIIAVLLVFNAALGLLHEGRAQATVKALKSRLALSAAVRRDGAWTIIPAAEIVHGDIVKLSLGSVVAADVRLLAGAVLLDQSMLTGESLPIEAGPGRGPGPVRWCAAAKPWRR
jgi:E1-E2 ATPase/cation transport ATPase-like protein